MEKKEFYLTPEGADKLRLELEVLRGEKRDEIAERLRHAVEMGDLSENADYITAKEAQAFLEGRIQELELVLRDAIIVEKELSADSVGIGSSVVVVEKGNSPETFQIVGVKESNSQIGKISHESPIGKALMGKRVGEKAIAKTPAGTIEFDILEIL
ncbi:MAG: transcription elongation factor GreA [Anaerolineales bacterium]|nr:transcription elongation factor GreA [Anaerolineales bacterium]